MENKEQGFKGIFSKPPAIWLSNVDTNTVDNKNKSASWDIVKNEVVGTCKECGRPILRKELGNKIDGARKDLNGDWHCAFDYSSLEHKPVEMIRKETLNQSITSEDYRIKEKELQEIQRMLNRKSVNDNIPDDYILGLCPLCNEEVNKKGSYFLQRSKKEAFGEGFWWHTDCYLSTPFLKLTIKQAISNARNLHQIIHLSYTDCARWLSNFIGKTGKGHSMPVSRALQLIREAEYHD